MIGTVISIRPILYTNINNVDVDCDLDDGVAGDFDDDPGDCDAFSAR